MFFGPNFVGPVFRNAGGRATPDAIRSISILRYLAGVETVAVVHHSDCGMTHLTDEGIAQEALEKTPNAKDEIDKIHFGCFKEKEYEDILKADVRTLMDQKILSGMEILGFALDTFTGEVEHIHVDRNTSSRL
ncbi:hypothetical protein LTR86_011041 [Recurvomyces mirabilis]|nr:hypothetical protein LTR86_011041 [Recurvomyces mirabilis]